jgi:4-hydroxy-3-methylbut-2-enyl diphosphate reductase
MRREGREIVMIGHKGHPEVEGTMGQSGDGMYLVETVADARQLQVKSPAAWPTSRRPPCRSTTPRRSIAALKERFPEIIGPKKDDICYATQNRQDAVKQLARTSEVVIVVGSRVEFQLESPARSRRTDRQPRLPGRPGRTDRPRLAQPAPAASASPPAPRHPKSWSRTSSIGCREATARKSPQLDGAEENVTFALPRELQPQHHRLFLHSAGVGSGLQDGFAFKSAA